MRYNRFGAERYRGVHTGGTRERTRGRERQREKESEDGTAASGRLVGCLATDQQPSEQLTVHDKQQRQQQHTHIRTTRRTAEQLESDSYFFSLAIFVLFSSFWLMLVLVLVLGLVSALVFSCCCFFVGFVLVFFLLNGFGCNTHSSKCSADDARGNVYINELTDRQLWTRCDGRRGA